MWIWVCLNVQLFVVFHVYVHLRVFELWYVKIAIRQCLFLPPFSSFHTLPPLAHMEVAKESLRLFETLTFMLTWLSRATWTLFNWWFNVYSYRLFPQETLAYHKPGIPTLSSFAHAASWCMHMKCYNMETWTKEDGWLIMGCILYMRWHCFGLPISIHVSTLVNMHYMRR